MCYEGVDDDTRIGGHIFYDAGLVDRRVTEREERGVRRGRDCELTARRDNWRSLLVVLVKPAQMHEPGCRGARCVMLVRHFS